MKDNDKVTMTIRQLKKLVKESKQLNKASYNDEYVQVPMVAFSTLDKRLGSFDHVQRDKNVTILWFLNSNIYCPTTGPLHDLVAAITIDNDRIYFNAQPDFFDSLDEAINKSKKYIPKQTLDSYLEDDDGVGVIKFGNVW